MTKITLTKIIAAMNTRDEDGKLPHFVCTQLAEQEFATLHHKAITPILYRFIRTLAPDLIIASDEMSVMDRWIDYAAFKSSTDPQIQSMAQFLHFGEERPNRSPGQSYIDDDNAFKVKFYTYLLEKHGDQSFDLPDSVARVPDLPWATNEQQGLTS